MGGLVVSHVDITDRKLAEQGEPGRRDRGA
jgi:hypothetical protein